ncbi:MAG: tRNA (adenosine(37)-N6)-threonylcarbamoyltransferase complex dimerization subunit type 1 TsaB [Paludibacter sp.]|nr:tRNA (adenosine(37)-N6)-threonylcarbamoyltransferase complex dimerization subunit type 1 TsaB [Bacteroidales bacterium]MCM1068551.1 tRNA (adenosine(37)-N6)-threonylcarbamoyltransferase complex dimerization subunit type 1 TsaB [Prevotella sp.]MCM1353215.1 tRNA (adenosine(37)-N6)-threonylcarbamoyltransferase complex dimerization subunit type 1 TsaB [Bacteroides sp.]MCM1442377.1 tRNA (adenosine(37)-N6)-threonylcarbamoyltransferase complex dimerization subunit type 1 TsaB [Muribaculum sp.]MCM148
MLILNIETSTNVCSAALSENGILLRYHIDTETHNHAKQLPLFIEELLGWLDLEKKTLDAVALSQGPGSYTGLRIGTATAKGICYGRQIPLIAIDTLQILAQGVTNRTEADYLCPMIDARRMEVYCTLYDKDVQKLSETAAQVIDENSFGEWLAQGKIYFFGDGADKCKEVLSHENAVFMEGIMPDARNMVSLAEAAFRAREFADIAYFSPYYLKEYQPAHSKNKVLQA